MPVSRICKYNLSSKSPSDDFLACKNEYEYSNVRTKSAKKRSGQSKAADLLVGRGLELARLNDGDTLSFASSTQSHRLCPIDAGEQADTSH